MPDVTGYRAKWGIIIPSTNTITEHDFALLTPHGITCHSGRALITDQSMDSDAAASALLDQMDEGLNHALAEVMSLQPDRIIIAMSAEVIRRGVTGGDEFLSEIATTTGLPVTAGPQACTAALRLLGARRIAIISPYQAQSDAITKAYFEEVGFDVVAIKGLRCASATAIAQVPAETVIATLKELDGPQVDAFLQVGTALSTVRIAAEAERWLGKPMIAMNTATVWSALRESGFNDVVPYFGSILEKF
jgi:maleate isomerase